MLKAIRALLAPQGRFAFETRNPVTVTCKIERPFDGRVISFTQTYTSPSWDESRVSWSTLRFLDTSTLTLFLSEAELAVESQFGDWDRTRLTDASPEIITVARRREEGSTPPQQITV